MNEKAKAISELVNSTLFSPMETGVQLSRDHRYLVNEVFKMFLHFSAQLARDYDNGCYDARDEYACKCSKTLIDALHDADLYHRGFHNDSYDKIIETMFD